MEVPLQQGSPTSPNKETFRTVKPPDQCVISYNFQHAGSLNFTHNLLIGMGLDEPARKQNSSTAASSKQKLFSIIPQPKKVFRNEPTSVSKAYSTAIMPKRYAPSTHKPRNNPNFSQHAPSEPRERNSNQRGTHNQQEYSYLGEESKPTERDTLMIAEFSSPYSVLAKKKTDKASFNKNQKGENKLSAHLTSQTILSPKQGQNRPLRYEAENEQTMTRQPQNKGFLDASNLIREVSQDKESQSNLLQNMQQIQKDLSVQPVSIENVQNVHAFQQKSSFMNAKPSSVISIKPEQTGKQEILRSNVSIEPTQQNEPQNSSNPLISNPAFATKNAYPGSSKQKLMYANPIQNEETKFRSKKEIQDEQLQELEARVRREESAKFKKGYFRVSSSKDKQVLPYQAGIQPLFTANPSSKQSFTQLAAKNASMSTNIKTNLFKASEIDAKKTIEQVARSSGFSSNSFNLTSPKTTNIATNKINVANQDNKIAQRNSNSKASRFVSPAHQVQVIQNRQKENIKSIPSLKRQSNNLNNILATQKIKRVTQDLSMKTRNFQPENEEKNRSDSNEPAQDLTANNQIKGFKIPQKVLNKAPKISKVESHSNIMQRPSKGFDDKKGNDAITMKDHEGKGGQKSPSHSSSVLVSPNNINSIKRPTNQGNQRANNNYRRSSSNSKLPINKPSLNKPTNKLVSNSDSHRYSQIGPDTKTRRIGADDAIIQEKANNTLSKQAKPRANQSAFVQKAEKSTQKGKVNQKPLQPTVARQPKDKDHKLKKWRDAELQELQKQRRQSKRREQSNASKEKERQSKQNMSKMRQKKSQIIDLDADEEDKFGLKSLRKTHSNSKSKSREGKGDRMVKRMNTEGIQERQYQEQHSSVRLEGNSGQQQALSQRSSESGQVLQKHQQKQEYKEDEGLMDQNLDKISSIHSSKITEQEEQPTQRLLEQSNSKSLSPRQNLEDLLKATQESPPNKHHDLPLQIEFQNSNFAQPITNQQHQAQKYENEYNLVKSNQPQVENGSNIEQDVMMNEKNTPIQQGQIQQQQQRQQMVAAQQEKKEAQPQNQQESIKNGKQEDPQQQQQALQNVPIVIPIMGTNIQNGLCQDNQPNKAEVTLQQKISGEQRMKTPLANISNAKQQDFFEYNIKQMSKFNQTVNQTINITKYETFDRDLSEYTRAPIISFLYRHSQTIVDSINSFQASSKRISLLEQANMGEPAGEEAIDQAIGILLSIDNWIVQRIFEPFLNKDGEVGVWLHWQGQWQVVQVEGYNFRTVLQKAINKLSTEKGLQFSLEDVLRLISGVRVAKLKSSKKRVLSELDYSLNKKHVLKAVTAKNSKWGERMFEVVKVEISKQGGNVLKLKEKSEYFWVREEKFQQIFQHFLLICTRPSHFWTNTLIASKESHKSVLCIGSQAAVHGSVTLYYPSQQRSSLCFYKELQSKVLKFMGKIEEKANQNGNLYFQFRMHGTYYLFLETPADCQLAIESTSKLTIGEPEYIVSQTLKNEKCEYVEIEHARSIRPAGKQIQMETLEKLREQFINMVSTK